MHPFLNTAIMAVRKAGNHIVRSGDKRSKIRITKKENNSFVTNVDIESEEIIITALNRAYPRHNYITEEQGEIHYSNDDSTWIIDPLDGTTNFIHNYPSYCISLAFRQENRIEQAIIYNPVNHDMFTATRGEGAQYNGTRMRVNNRHTFDDALLSIGIPRDSDRLAQYFNIIQQLHGHTSGIRKSGSTALHLAYVAAGFLDGFSHSGQKIWDLAAGSLLVKESGGLITDYRGGESYFDKGECLVANPKLLRRLVKLFAGQP